MKTILTRTLIILSFLWAGVTLAAETLTFYVAPNGSDTASGLSVDTPFQTLEKAPVVGSRPSDFPCFSAFYPLTELRMNAIREEPESRRGKLQEQEVCDEGQL